MADYVLYIVLLAGSGFVAGTVLTLIVSEHALAARRRRQAQRERELAALSDAIDDRLALLASSAGPAHSP